MIHPRPSRVLDKLRRGEYVYCFKHNLESSRAVEISALNGFDCVWVCAEHISNDASLTERQVLAGKAHGIDVLVRVPRGGYSELIRPLELDAAGIMVPHVISAADAAAVVRNTRFHPLGRRPVDGGNADGLFCNLGVADYFAFANANRFVIVQIEDVEALDELDAIAAVPGIDMLFFGPGDFSHSLGAPGELDHPQVAAARQKVADAARRHGKFAGTVAAVESLDALHALGYQFLNIGSDVGALSAYCASIMTVLADRPRRFAAEGEAEAAVPKPQIDEVLVSYHA